MTKIMILLRVDRFMVENKINFFIFCFKKSKKIFLSKGKLIHFIHKQRVQRRWYIIENVGARMR